MKRERYTGLRLVEPDIVQTDSSDIEVSESITDSKYQSDPVRRDLYSKLAAYRQSLRKFNIRDLIRDSLK